MEVISSQQQSSLSVNSIDHGNFSEQVKEEPFDDGDVKNGLFKLEDQNVSAINKELSPTWSLLIERCHLLLTSEKKKNRLDPISITKILVKEVNELLFDIVKFFQECYSVVGHTEEKSNEDLLLEVSGLLINSLPFNRCVCDLPYYSCGDRNLAQALGGTEPSSCGHLRLVVGERP